MTDVLVFVPGVMGSELWKGANKIWPGSLKDGLFGFSDAKFQLLLDPALEARDILRRAGGVIEVYEPWIETFASLRSRDPPGQMFREDGAKPTLVCVPYDWRKSVEEAAEHLARALARVHALHGSDAAIHIAAHSLGGLVSRHYLQSGIFADRPGFAQVRTLLTFGTPHKGAPIALAGALGLDKAYFLNAEQTATIANDSRYPALYQLFPQQGTACIWDGTTGGRLNPLDIFEDRAFARTLGLNGRSLDKAAALHEVLARPWPDIRRFLFIGSRFETLTHFLWNGTRAVPVRTKDGGDGTVPLHCSVIEGHQIRFTDKNHGAIARADEARWALQDLFHADGFLALDVDTKVSLTVRDLVVGHRQPVEIALKIEGPGTALEGLLFLERARPAAGADQVIETDFAALPEHARRLDYSGPDLKSLHVFFEDVAGPAIFRPVFAAEDPPRRFVGPAFVVKAPE